MDTPDGRRVGDRWVFDRQLVEPSPELGPRGGREAAADLAGVSEGAVLEGGHEQRAESGVGALAQLEADHHQLLLPADLHLEPGARPLARVVGRSAQLGDDALHAVFPGGVEEGLAIGLDVGQVAHPVGVPEHASQEPLAVLERHAEQ